MQGLKGDAGSQGIQGIAGAKGDKGEPGVQGLKGDAGAQGIQGIAGAKGDKGELGLQGLKGDTGAQGIQGIAGAKGDQGLQGLKGDRGLPGLQGLQGVKGNKGDTGEPGIAGFFNTADFINGHATVNEYRINYVSGGYSEQTPVEIPCTPNFITKITCKRAGGSLPMARICKYGGQNNQCAESLVSVTFGPQIAYGFDSYYTLDISLHTPIYVAPPANCAASGGVYSSTSNFLSIANDAAATPECELTIVSIQP